MRAIDHMPIHHHLSECYVLCAKNHCSIDDFAIEDGSVNGLKLWGLQLHGHL